MNDLQALTLDQQIDQQHQALARAEADALQLTQRMRLCPGTESYLQRKRSYGQYLNPWADGNLSAQSAILRHDRPLAEFLAARAGKGVPTDYEAQEAEQRRQASIQRLEAETDRLRQQRQAREAQRRHVEQWGRIDRFTGNRVFH